MDFFDDFPTGRDSLPRCPRRLETLKALGRAPKTTRPTRKITEIIAEFHQAPLGGGGASPKPVIPSRLAPPFPTFAQPELAPEEPLEVFND